MGKNLEKLNELFNRRNIIENGSDKSIGYSDKLNARDIISKFLDENTFVEFGAFISGKITDFSLSENETPCDGVITGYGNVFGRLVFVYAQDETVLGGSVSEMHSKKICNIYENALKMGAPVVGFINSSGLRIEEGIDALSGYGDIFNIMVSASGVIPQITAIMGGCMGTSSFIPSLSDFTFAVNKDSKFFMVSPNTLSGDEGKSGDLSLKEDDSIIHFIYENQSECIENIRKFIDIIPSNNMEDAPFFGTNDDINRTDEVLNEIIPESLEQDIDMDTVIKTLADSYEFIEIQKNFAKEIKQGFIRINGYTVGVISNSKSLLTYNCIDKIVRFVCFCDAFNIPILTLTDIEGYDVSVPQSDLISKTSKLISAFSSATSPKVNIILRKGFGNPYIVMNSKHIGADVVFAWPSAEISVMNPISAVSVMYNDYSENDYDKQKAIFEYQKNNSSPYIAAKKGYIDDIIEPSSTRKRVAAVLEMLSTKRVAKPTKKHSSFMI